MSDSKILRVILAILIVMGLAFLVRFLLGKKD